VLIGAFDSPWTLRTAGQLRFTFRKESEHDIGMVLDRQHPKNTDWKLTNYWPNWDIPIDYAIVSRMLDPATDSTFRTLSDRDHRAMAGLSMGGMQTLQFTLNHLDLFSYIGGFSGAGGMLVLGNRKLDPKTDYNGVFADPASFAKKVHLLWLGVGTVEPERMRAGLQRLHASLDEAKIQHVSYESPGTDHEWQTWRRDLKDFAPRLF